jgi:hypothetical protein
LVGGGCEFMGVVAELRLDAGEELAVRGIDELFGHTPGGLLGGGPQLGQERLDTGFAVFRGG